MSDSQHSKFKEINALKLENKQLQVEYENQSIILLATEQRLKEAQLKLKPVTNDGAFLARMHAREILTLQQAKTELASRMEALQSSEDHSAKQLRMLKELAGEQRGEIAQANMTASATMKDKGDLQAQVQKFKTLALSNEEEHTKDLASIGQLQGELNEYREQMAMIEEERTNFVELKLQRESLQKHNRQLQHQILAVSRDAATKTHQFQSELQATKQYLEELKLEMEDFSKMTRNDHELYRQKAASEYNVLKSEFESYRARQQEMSQEQYQDQQIIVQTLQEQFTEYRSTCEELFYKEAQHLERKVQQKEEQYEKEIRYIIKTKDLHFGAMLTAKDAKIMNLVEGTDFHKLLLKHSLELEQLRSQHERDIELARETVEAEAKSKTEQLRQQLRAQQAEVDKYQHQLLTWERKLEQTMALLKKQKNQHQEKEESGEAHLKGVQEQLNAAFTTIEGLIQTKENLRHRILRLRLQIEGKSDDSIETVISKLSTETGRLGEALATMSTKYERESSDRAAMAVQNRRHVKAIHKLRASLEAREQEHSTLVTTFESFLQRKVRKHAQGSMPSFTGLDQFARSEHASDPSSSSLNPLVSQAGCTYSHQPCPPGSTRAQSPLHGAMGGAMGHAHPQQHRKSGLLSTGLSRSQRLHDVLKGVPNMQATAELAEANRREDAMQSPWAHRRRGPQARPDDQPFRANEEERKLSSSSQSARGTLHSSRRHKAKLVKFQLPRRLQHTESDMVDVNSIVELEKGLHLLDAFKKHSKEFSAEMRALKKKSNVRAFHADLVVPTRRGPGGGEAAGEDEDSSEDSESSVSAQEDAAARRRVGHHDSLSTKTTRLYRDHPNTLTLAHTRGLRTTKRVEKTEKTEKTVVLANAALLQLGGGGAGAFAPPPPRAGSGKGRNGPPS